MMAEPEEKTEAKGNPTPAGASGSDIELWHGRWLLKCPGCGVRGEIDEDQLHGRVSVLCTTAGCGYHETKNWRQVWEGGHPQEAGGQPPEAGK